MDFTVLKVRVYLELIFSTNRALERLLRIACHQSVTIRYCIKDENYLVIAQMSMFSYSGKEL